MIYAQEGSQSTIFQNRKQSIRPVRGQVKLNVYNELPLKPLKITFSKNILKSY